MLKYLATFLLLSAPAFAQSADSSFLGEPDLAAANARSAAQCNALGCDGVRSVYWWPVWPVWPLSDGTAAVEILASAPYGASATTLKGTAGLSTAERAALVPYSTIAPLLPAQ